MITEKSFWKSTQYPDHYNIAKWRNFRIEKLDTLRELIVEHHRELALFTAIRSSVSPRISIKHEPNISIITEQNTCAGNSGRSGILQMRNLKHKSRVLCKRNMLIGSQGENLLSFMTVLTQSNPNQYYHRERSTSGFRAAYKIGYA